MFITKIVRKTAYFWIIKNKRIAYFISIKYLTLTPFHFKFLRKKDHRFLGSYDFIDILTFVYLF